MFDKLIHSVYIKFSHEGEAPPKGRAGSGFFIALIWKRKS